MILSSINLQEKKMEERMGGGRGDFLENSIMQQVHVDFLENSNHAERTIEHIH